MSRWFRVALSAALAMSMAPLFATPVAEPMTRQLMVKFKQEGTARRLLPPQSRLALLAADRGVPLSYVRSMALAANVVALDRDVPFSEAQALAARLATHADVEYAQADRRLQPMLVPNDEFVPKQTYLGNGPAAINAFAAWDVTTGSDNVVVAVVDTGFRPHAGLVGRIIQGYDFISDTAIANDGNGRDADASDPGDWVTQSDKSGPFRGDNCSVVNSTWHGTAVAGVIGSNGNDRAWTAGIDWSARILPVRVLGKCGGMFSDIIDGVAWAAGLEVPGAPVNTTPAHVINMSLGDPSTSNCGPAEQSVFNAALAHGVTRAIVIAAGNEADDIARHAPANCTGVITVGATTSAGDSAVYSNFGATMTLSAPGGQYPLLDGIYALTDSGRTAPAGDAVAMGNGTSFSAPIVSGVVSLMLAVAPNLNAAQVRSILTSTAKPFPATSNCTPGVCGAGIVNSQAAVRAAQEAAGNADYTDLWWFGPAYNGTGVSIIEHHDVLFATWYVNDANGKGSWRVMPGGTWNSAHTIFSGAMYTTSRAPFNNNSPPEMLQAGTLAFRFSDSGNATLSYAMTGQSGVLAMQRQPFGAVVAPTHLDYSDLWWGGAAQDGWGLTLNQHYDTLVAIWYTYGLDGKPVFYIMPDGTWTSSTTIGGPIYATTGTPFGLPYEAAQYRSGVVGNGLLSFSDISHARFTYTIDGIASQSKDLVRQPF